MGYKVKSVDKLEEGSSGAVKYLIATVTYTDGVKDYTEQVQSEPINPNNRTVEEVDVFLKESIESAIAAKAKAIDAIKVSEAKMDTLKTAVLDSLTQAGLTILLALMFCCIPMKAWAGDLYPSWEAMTNLTTAAGVSLSGLKPSYMGTINCSAHYVVEVNINWEESGNNPAGNAGISLYAVSGTTNGYIPFTVSEIAPADYTNNYNADNAPSGVTRTFIIENIPYIAIGIGKTAADADTFHVRYRRMKGQY